MSGADVEQFYREGRIREIADYCETDVVNTYRVWLRYELFRGRLADAEFRASEDHQGPREYEAAPCRFGAKGLSFSWTSRGVAKGNGPNAPRPSPAITIIDRFRGGTG